MQRPPDPPGPGAERKYRSRARQATARTDASAEVSQIEPQAEPAAQPKLVRSGASSPVRRVDIVIPRLPPPEAPRPQAANRPQGGQAGAARSRIQQEEKEFQLPKGLWLSLLIGVLCVAATVALVVAVRGWVGDYRAEQEELKRAEAERIDRANHPLSPEYRVLVERYAAMYNLDPALVAAVILCESSFNPGALSRVGARGLMQLMPDTANEIAAKLNVPDFTLDRLFEPEVNVQMGASYLSYLAEWFDGDLRKMICGYHAGLGNVGAWLRNTDYSPDGVTLAVIPSDVGGTADYEDRVRRAILAYQTYHFGEDAQGKQ
jgi:soluble lytic murein transglycosylase